MEEWRCDDSHNGLDLGDGGPPFLDLRFADDILLFAGSAEQLGYMLDNRWLHSKRLVSNSTLQKQRLWQLKRNHQRHWQLVLVWRWQGWTSRRPISGWVVCCRRKMQAHDRTILTTDYNVRPVHSVFENGFSVTKWFQWHLAWNFLMLWLHRWFVLQLGTAKFIQLIFENLTCIAGNCFDALWVRQLTLIGTSHGIQYFMHGTDGLINNWNTMVSKWGHIFPFVILLPSFFGWRCFDWRDVRIAGFGAAGFGPDTWPHYSWRRFQRLYWRLATWGWLAFLGLVGCWSQEPPWRAFSKLGCAEWVSHFEPANKCTWHKWGLDMTKVLWRNPGASGLHFGWSKGKCGTGMAWQHSAHWIGPSVCALHCHMDSTRESHKGVRKRTQALETILGWKWECHLIPIQTPTHGGSQQRQCQRTTFEIGGRHFDGWKEGGECKRIQTRFLPSDDLKQLRLQRRMAQDRGIKKKLSFEIVKLRRRELRKWKSSNPQMHLREPNQWKILQRLQHGIGRQIADQPPPNDFADMLENIFSGHPSNPSPPPQLTEADWNLQELKVAIFFFFFLRTFLAAWRFTSTKLFYWAASRHRLFLYWPVSRCAWGREGISPDLPLPGWQATGWHGRGGVGKEVAEGWKIYVQVVVGREVFKQQAGSEGRRCCVGEESWPPGHQSGTGGCLEWRGAGAGSGVGKYADEVGCFIRLQSSGWRQTKLRMNVVWSQSYCTLLLRTFGALFPPSWTLVWEMVKSHARRAKCCSKCCQKRNNPKSQLISGPSQTSASCTKFLHIWFFDTLKHRWNSGSLRNNMGLEEIAGWKGTFWLPTWWLTKHC